MTDKTINDLTAATSTDGTEPMPVWQSSGTKKLAISKIKDYILGLANTWSDKQTMPQLTLSGNVTASGIFGTDGIGLTNAARTLTDSSSSGTVATAYTNKLGGNTLAAGSSTTITDHYSLFLDKGTAGTNVTLTRAWALGTSGSVSVGGPTLLLGGPDAAAPVAQTIKAQSVVAGTTNTAGANLTIDASQGTGTGNGGSIIFRVAPKGSSGSSQNTLAATLTFTSTKEILPQAAGEWSIGSTSAAINQVYASAVNVSRGGSFNFTDGASRGSIKSPADGVFTLLDAAGTSYGRLQLGGTTSSFPSIKRSSAALVVRLADDSANAALEAASLTTDAPTGGTAATWKLGVKVDATTTLDTAKYLQVDVGGTLYKVALVTS